MDLSKKELGRNFLNKRKALSDTEHEKMTDAIVNRCLELPVWEHSIFHLFLPIEKQREVDTTVLLPLLQGKDKQVVLPKTEPDTTLRHYLLTDETRIMENRWGVPEPQGGLEIQPEQIEVVFVPLLAFDLQGFRVGYGKGFYDRFLALCNPNTVKIGLSFFYPVEAIQDRNPFDVPLNFCVTPQQYYSFPIPPLHELPPAC